MILKKSKNTNPQQIHYDRMYDAYNDHYYDKWSMKYRELFFYNIMFGGLDLNNKNIAELACGSGYNYSALLKKFPSVRITGYDISDKACNEYRRLVKMPCYQLDIMRDNLPPRTYDMAFVIGGLHHCIADIETTIRNISQTIKPNGQLIMFKPDRDFLLQSLRDAWYRKDKLFDADSEKSLSYHELLTKYLEWFHELDVTYGGGPGYFLILNSLVFRLPRIIKTLSAIPLMLCDSIYNLLPGHFLFPYFIARWVRKECP